MKREKGEEREKREGENRGIGELGRWIMKGEMGRGKG